MLYYREESADSRIQLNIIKYVFSELSFIMLLHWRLLIGSQAVIIRHVNYWVDILRRSSSKNLNVMVANSAVAHLKYQAVIYVLM